MKALSYYEQFIPEDRKNTLKTTLCGYCLELSIKDYLGLPLVLSPAGKVDVTMPINGKNRKTEIKQNGGDWRNNCKGESFVAYCPYVDLDKPLNQQFGYIVVKTAFVRCAEKVNLIRHGKKDSKGYSKDSLQTVYNYKLNQFHGAKAFKFTALLEDETNALTFKEYFID